MDNKVKKPIAILNLVGELSSELVSYFAQKQILVVDPEVNHIIYDWTHILTKDVHDFSHLKDTYDTILKDVRIISLSNVDDLQHFISCNGKLILNSQWMENQLGEFILDKFLQEYGGISLSDNYPTFRETGSFNITNPFNTGEYLDRLVHSAFLDGISGLSIKTYFDHLVMYLTGLKTKGKLGMPIEVTYGYYKDIFGVQLHFFTKNLVLEDVTASLSNTISKQAESYLLKVAIQSSDFFDFTVLKEVNKTVVTGLWTKDSKIQVENRGLIFNEISASAPITNYPIEGITSYQMNNPELKDFSDQVILPDSPEEEISQIIKGLDAEPELAQIIHGTKVEDEIITIVKGKIEEEEEVFRVSGSHDFDVDKFAYRISAGIEEKGKKEDVLKIQSLKNELPEGIKNGLRDYTARLNKSVDEISEQDLIEFKEKEVPRIIQEATKRVDSAFVIQRATTDSIEMKSMSVENDLLKSKVKSLATEVKLLKEIKTRMAEIHQKAKSAAEASIQKIKSEERPDEDLRTEMVQKMQVQKSLDEHDTIRLAELMERETKLLKDAKEHELKAKRLQIEMFQKESSYNLEFEKLNRLIKSKDLIVTKTKDGMAKLVEQKDKEITSVSEKLNQASKALVTSNSHGQQTMIRELERKVINHEKMIEIYKNKISQKPVEKVEDSVAKEENRRLQMLNIQMKNMLDMAKKELTKAHERASQDTIVMNTMKADKVKMDQLLKKTILEVNKSDTVTGNHVSEHDYRKLQAQFEMIDTQLKESYGRSRELEAKLHEALKAQKKEIVAEEVPTRGKAAQLEGNVRKLTQDLVESKNQQAEMKKEVNKLRQEKTALQNQIDKMKKEADKSKTAAPKKPGSGGKAA